MTGSVEKIVTASSVKVEHRWKSASPQCDGISRVISVGKSAATVYETKTTTEYIYASPVPSDLPDPHTEPVPHYPVCEIRPQDCQEQWDLFRGAFANWSASFDEVGAERTFAACKDTKVAGEACPSENTLDINSYVTLRNFLALRGFFGSCPQPEQACLANAKEVDQRLGKRTFDTGNPNNDIQRACEVRAERFVLIHFPQPTNVSQTICGINDSHSVNEDQSLDGTGFLPVTLESIVFQEKDVTIGYGDTDSRPRGTTSKKDE
jgi:hypothetical protein